MRPKPIMFVEIELDPIQPNVGRNFERWPISEHRNLSKLKLGLTRVNRMHSLCSLLLTRIIFFMRHGVAQLGAQITHVN